MDRSPLKSLRESLEQSSELAMAKAFGRIVIDYAEGLEELVDKARSIFQTIDDKMKGDGNDEK